MSSPSFTVSVRGEQLRQVRGMLGWTQQESATRSGYSDRLIRKLERGGPVRPQTLIDVIQTYQEALNASPVLVPEDYIVPDTDHCELQSLIRRWFDGVFNQRDLSLIDTMVADDVVLVAEGARRRGREVIRQRVETLLGAFNPIHHEIERMFTDDGAVIAYWKVRKRHTGTFVDIPATNRWVELQGSSMVVFRDQRIVEGRDHWDIQDLLQQLTGAEGFPI